jgi:hypothetical protein
VMLQDAHNCRQITLKVLQKKGPINFARIVLNCVLKDGRKVKIAPQTEKPARRVGFASRRSGRDGRNEDVPAGD